MSPAEVGERLKRAGIPYEWRDFPVSAAAVAETAIAIPTGRLLGLFVIESYRLLAGNRSLARLARTCCDLRRIAPSVRLGSDREVFVLAMPDYPVIGGRIDMGLYLRGDGDCFFLPEKVESDLLDHIIALVTGPPDAVATYPLSLLSLPRPCPDRSWVGEQNDTFELIDDESILRRAPREALIAGILPAGSLACLYGKPGTMKTFVALDFALSIASGEPWARDYEVTLQGPVVYVVAEGMEGFRLRVAAWKRDHSVVGGQGLLIVGRAVQLTDESQITRFLRSLAQLPEPPVMVVVDTLARCFEGKDENSSKEMGALVTAADRIRSQTGAAVLFVHHAGWGEHGHERGSTALRGAADTMLSIKVENGRVTLACEKQKDFEPFGTLHFRSRQVAILGETSLVIQRDYCEQLVDDSLNDSEEAALAVLQNCQGDSNGRSFTEWQQASGLPKATFDRARKLLVDGGLVEKRGSKYFKTDRASENQSQGLNSVSPRSHETNPADVSVVSPPFRGETVRPGTAPVQNWDDIPSL